ncbi:MAG: hypothetical protein ACM3WV_10535 [Bacillota bacterium]
MEEEQDRYLKNMAAESGKSEAEILREALGVYQVRGAQSALLPESWEKEKAFLLELAEKSKKAAVKTRTTWTRDELHER